MPEYIATQPYRLYTMIEAMRAEDLDWYRTPIDIDFKTGLETTLVGKVDLQLGSRVKTTWYRDYDSTTDTYDWPVVVVDYIWTFDGAGLANDVSKEACWYLMDGTVDAENKKTFHAKHFTPEQKAEEAERRRKNQVNYAGKIVIGVLMAGGMDATTAYVEGSTYWASLTDERVQFVAGNKEPLRTRLDTDTTPAWATNVKAYALPELA